MAERGDDIANLTQLQREAHGWVRRLASGYATEDDAAELQGWCGQSPAHASAFVAAKKFWKTLGSAGHDLRSEEVRRVERDHARRVFSRRAMLGGAIAASVAGLAVIRPPLDLWPSIFEIGADYRTEKGEQRQIPIADAASVQMNTRTSLTVKSDAGGQVVELVSGEASFRVAPQATNFSVMAAGGRVRAGAAQFDVRVDGSEVCVTCLTDKVDVAYGARSVELQARQRVIYDGGEFRDVVSIDPAIATAWHQGLIVCDNTPLSQVVSELNRYRSGRIVLMRSDLARIPVSGRFKIAEPEQALLQIQRAFGVRVRSLPGGLALVS